MSIKIEDVKRIIAYKKTRLEHLAKPNVWIRYTKNMECGEERAFKQSCIDDEIIIEALERQILVKPIKKNPICYSRTKDGLEKYSYDYHCPNCGVNVNKETHHCPCGQALDWSDKE